MSGEINYCKSKAQFIEYCAGKISDLGSITYKDYFEDEINGKVIMRGDIREVNNGYVVVNLDDEWEETLVVVNEGMEEKINTRMCDPTDYAMRLEFTAIDTWWYNSILEYWEECDLDGYASW